MSFYRKRYKPRGESGFTTPSLNRFPSAKSQAPAIRGGVPIFIVQVLLLFCHITKLLSNTIKKRKLEQGKSTSLDKDISLLTFVVKLNSASQNQSGLKEK